MSIKQILEATTVTDMNDIRDIILQWERGFDTEEEKVFFYLKHCGTLQKEYWDMMPMDGKIKDHPWDNEDKI